MRIIMPRLLYTKTSTRGLFLVENKVFCYTLEDVVREKDALKIPGQTAISAGLYEVIVNSSIRFKRAMPLLLNVPNFTGIRIHGGNIASDTEGCILVAFNAVSDTTIQGTAETAVTNLLQGKPNEKHFIEIIDTYPYKGV